MPKDDMQDYFKLPPGIHYTEELKANINKKIEAFSGLSEDLPVFIIHNVEDLSVLYMSETGVNRLGTTLEAIQELGADYYNVYFNPEDSRYYLAKYKEFIASPENYDSWFTFFQQVKTIQGKEPDWYLSVSKIIAFDEHSKKPVLALTLALRLSRYLPIAPKLERLIEENNILLNNYQQFSLLTRKEKDVLKLVAQGHSIKEISSACYLSELTIRTHLRNIKKKLNAYNQYDLVKYAQAFNLI